MKKGIFFYILGIGCILYCLMVASVGFGTLFFLIWGVAGVCSIIFGLALDLKWFRVLPRWLRLTGLGVIAAGVLVFCVVEGMILSDFRAEAEPGADYCIILGAQWKKNGPSEVLRRRLDKAVEYLKENPETIVIVSGGQGSNERIPEAEGMAGYLEDAGIERERILVENKSRNTCENLEFSGKLIDKENSRVVIVTNNFHVFRALRIAKKQGYHAEGLAADSVEALLPNNLLREFVGVMKDTLMGNM